MSASSNTTTGALPPSSRWTRLRSAAALAATSLPARTEPVTETIAGTSWSTIARPVSRSPQMTLKHARRQELGGDLGEQRRARRGRVARLEHDGVAGGDRRRELPHRHHHRVVPRGDLGAHADRLAADQRRHVRHVLAGALALEVAGGGGEEADLVDHRRHLLRRRQGDRLAGVLDLDGDRARRHEPRWRRRCGTGRASAATASCRATRGRPPPRPSIAASTSAGPDSGAVAYCSPVTGLTTSSVCAVRRLDWLAVDEVGERLHGGCCSTIAGRSPRSRRRSVAP